MNTDSIREDNILKKIKELISMDLTKIKYHEIPHILFLVTKIVYEDRGLDKERQRSLIIKIVNILIDKTDMAPLIKKAVKDMIPHLIDKYVEIDNGSMRIKVRTYGRVGRMWIKVRTYLDRKILGIEEA